MFETMMGFADGVFEALVLLVCAGISSHICYGFGTRKAKEMFIGLSLILCVGIQLYFVMSASMNVTASKFYVYDNSIVSKTCLTSNKGGKRPDSATLTQYDINPCFCHSGASCIDVATGKIGSLHGVGVILAGLVVSTNNTCATDGTTICISPSQKKIALHVPSDRNCRGGFGGVCSINQPCAPCEIETLSTFNEGRCRLCASDNPFGRCQFVQGVGPYCYESPGSKTVVPCKSCCSSTETVFVGGECY